MKLFKLFTILIVSLSLSFSTGLFAGDKKEKDKKEDKSDKKDHKDHKDHKKDDKKSDKKDKASCEKQCGRDLNECNHETGKIDKAKEGDKRKKHHEKCQSTYQSCKSSCKT